MKKQLVLRALTDPKFRKLLEENPMAAMEMADVKGGYVDSKAILLAVVEVENTVSRIGEEILCTSGGAGCCGICLA
jgi:hypothetical protein